MPAYDYLCDACGSRFERRQKMSDSVIETCPACSGHVRRLVSGGAGAITKGSSHFEAPRSCGSGACCAQGSPCGDGICCNN
ncbi:MAG: zinc ribbon domain-containing protein [Terracidiphilus sp.]|jgi:putative FmdB family regulatory protein